ncbi:MAG: hypothetical protein L6R48_06560 [Planctomycetes bacterium]|nr:hypothetical protein [Planctomycetota bacterium]
MRATRLLALLALTAMAAAAEAPRGGPLLFVSYPERDRVEAAAALPALRGALFTVYWSTVEAEPGRCAWDDLERRVRAWRQAGKGWALRIMWSASGTWPDPAARAPTPAWVEQRGAAVVVSQPSGTRIPLVWDPVWRQHAEGFLRQVAERFDGDPDLLFIDITPGAETNPYRFRRLDRNDPGLRERFRAAAASDGRRYDDQLWLGTVRAQLDAAAAAIRRTPLLVTLNTGALDGGGHLREIGDHAAALGMMTGQNGLTGGSYRDDSPRRQAFLAWGARRPCYFEMLDAAGGGTGSLDEVVSAAQRAGGGWLGVYSTDVLRCLPGRPDHDPARAAALARAAEVLAR